MEYYLDMFSDWSLEMKNAMILLDSGGGACVVEGEDHG